MEIRNIYIYTLQSIANEFTNNTLDFVKTSDIRFIIIILAVFMKQLSKEMHVCLFYPEMKQANMQLQAVSKKRNNKLSPKTYVVYLISQMFPCYFQGSGYFNSCSAICVSIDI